MRTKEYYYGSWQYDSAGIEPFLEHVKQYLDGSRTIPVTRGPSISSESLFFTFSDELHRVFIDDLVRIKKAYESALKYGYRGYSKGGKNGVFLLRKQDCGLAKAISSVKSKFIVEILQDLDCDTTDLPNLKDVKIVCHDLSGTRVVGVLNEINGRAIFLGFEKY